MRLRIALVPLLLAVAVATSACGSDSPGGGSASTGDAGLSDVADANPSPPPCPFTAQQVNEITGRSLKDLGHCEFGDGTASITVMTFSEFAGSTAYDFSRQQADQLYAKVVDVDQGDRGFIAIKDVEAKAMAVGKKGSYTLIMSSFEFDAAKYESTLRALLDKIFG